MDAHFFDTYEACRARFMEDAKRLSARWPASHLQSHPLKAHPDLSIDCLWAEPRRKENLVMVSIAEHGIEGYVGSAMLKCFMDEFAPLMDVQNTGLLLVHAINPWGMQQRLRVNPNNVDLNRNFIFDGNYSPALNPDYDVIADLLNPRRPVRNFRWEALLFWIKILKNLIRPGKARLQAASLLGQHRHPDGIYYGGVAVEDETAVMIALYRTALEQYQNFIQVDMHTGYGPRYQMTLIIPPTDPISSKAAAEKFGYPRVQKIDAGEFYAISGDMGEYVYRLRDADFPATRVFACGFEFGTFGDTLPALIRSLRITVLENQLRQWGAETLAIEERVRAEYGELFFPVEAKWREKALADCRQALRSILISHGLLSSV